MELDDNNNMWDLNLSTNHPDFFASDKCFIITKCQQKLCNIIYYNNIFIDNPLDLLQIRVI